MAKRIERSRERGWRKPVGAVIVDRTSRWGNPYDFRDLEGGRAEAVERFAGWIVNPQSEPIWWYGGKKPKLFYPSTVEEIRAQLGGRYLVCFCGLDEPCHADVLLDIANR
jgi:hypothetical protein